MHYAAFFSVLAALFSSISSAQASTPEACQLWLTEKFPQVVDTPAKKAAAQGATDANLGMGNVDEIKIVFLRNEGEMFPPIETYYVEIYSVRKFTREAYEVTVEKKGDGYLPKKLEMVGMEVGGNAKNAFPDPLAQTTPAEPGPFEVLDAIIAAPNAPAKNAVIDALAKIAPEYERDQRSWVIEALDGDLATAQRINWNINFGDKKVFASQLVHALYNQSRFDALTIRKLTDLIRNAKGPRGYEATLTAAEEKSLLSNLDELERMSRSNLALNWQNVSELLLPLIGMSARERVEVLRAAKYTFVRNLPVDGTDRVFASELARMMNEWNYLKPGAPEFAALVKALRDFHFNTLE